MRPIQQKKPDSITIRLLAEKEGFEPPGQLCRPADFESAPFDHSGISPRQKYKNLCSAVTHHKKIERFSYSHLLTWRSSPNCQHTFKKPIAKKNHLSILRHLFKLGAVLAEEVGFGDVAQIFSMPQYRQVVFAARLKLLRNLFHGIVG